MLDNTAPILFKPHYHEAMRTFLPVIERLKADGYSVCVLLSPQDKSSQAICDQFNLPVQFMPPPVLKEHLKGGTLLQFAREGLRARRFADSFIDRLKPAMLVMTDDRLYLESFLIERAKSHNIPAMAIMWAATNPQEIMLVWRKKAAYNKLNTVSYRLLAWIARLLLPQMVIFDDNRYLLWKPPGSILSQHLLARSPKQPWILGGGNANYIAVVGDYYRTMLIEHGVSPNKVVATGHPRHDLLYREGSRWKNEERATICREIGAPADKKLIVLGTPPAAHIIQGTRAGHVSAGQMADYLREVVAKLLSLDNQYHLIVKIHPRDEELPLPYLDGHTKNFTVVRRYEIAKLIACSELLVCQGSTVVFDAHILGTPALTFDFYNSPGYDLWAKAGGVLHITDRADFLPSVHRLLSDSQTRDRLEAERQIFIRDYVKPDGKATERIVNIIQTSIAKGRKI